MTFLARRPSRAIIAKCLAACIAVSGAMPASLSASEVAPAQREQIEGVVRDYLLKNPEILHEALTILEKRQQEKEQAAVASAARNITQIPANDRSIVLGNPDGDVTVVEFFDYNCGYCKRALGDMEALVKADPRVKVVIRDFPVIRPESMQAAMVSIAAGQQLSGEKYYRFHSDLLMSKGVVGKEQALAAAKAAGADMKRLEQDLESETVKQILAHTMEAGQQLSLTGTPSFVTGDGVVAGAVGADALKSVVTAVRQCGKLEC